MFRSASAFLVFVAIAIPQSHAEVQGTQRDQFTRTLVAFTPEGIDNREDAGFGSIATSSAVTSMFDNSVASGSLTASFDLDLTTGAIGGFSGSGEASHSNEFVLTDVAHSLDFSFDVIESATVLDFDFSLSDSDARIATNTSLMVQRNPPGLPSVNILNSAAQDTNIELAAGVNYTLKLFVLSTVESIQDDVTPSFSFSGAFVDAEPDTFKWNSASGGTFSAAFNWVGNQAPEEQDTIEFDLASTYEVDIDGDRRFDSMLVKQGNVTFDVSDGRLLPTGKIQIGSPDSPAPKVFFKGRSGNVSASTTALIVASQSTPPPYPGCDGDVAICGPSLTLSKGEATYLGNETFSFPTVSVDGMEITTPKLTIGQQTPGADDVALDFYIEDLRVGRENTGELVIGETLTVLNTRSVTLGGGAGSSGKVFVGFPGPDDVTPGVNGGTWNIDVDISVGEKGRGGILILNGGTVNSRGDMIIGEDPTGTGEVTIQGRGSQLNFNSIVIDRFGSGSIEVVKGGKLRATSADSVLTIGTDGRVELDSDLAERSIVEVADSSSLTVNIQNRDVLDDVSALSIGPRSTFNATVLRIGSPDVSLVQSAPVVTLNANSSTLAERANLFVTQEIYLGKDAELRIDSNSVATVGVGEITIPSFQTLTITNGGKLTGIGKIIGDLVVLGGDDDGFFGEVLPGTSPGTLTVDGNATISGLLEIEIAGTLPGSEHDVLEVTGDSVVDGKVVFRFIDGFAPQQGDEFAFLSAAGSLEVGDAEFEVAGLLPGFEFNVVPSASGFQLRALTDGQAIPEPSGLVLALFAAALAGCRSAFAVGLKE